MRLDRKHQLPEVYCLVVRADVVLADVLNIGCSYVENFSTVIENTVTRYSVK